MGDVGAVAAERAEHEGIITVERAVGCGLSRGQIQRRLASGAWKPVTRGVYRSASHPYTESAMVRAAVAAHRGVADRTTAAWWHGLLAELPDQLTIAVRSKPTALRWTGGTVKALRRRYHADDVTSVRGLAVTGLPMTVLTAAAALDDGSRLMDRALQSQPVTVADLEASLERNAGIAGFARARRLVAVAGGDTESAAERLFVDLLVAERIGGWELQRTSSVRGASTWPGPRRRWRWRSMGGRFIIGRTSSSGTIANGTRWPRRTGFRWGTRGIS